MAADTQTQVACDIKDLALADLGKRRTEWAFQSMPVGSGAAQLKHRAAVTACTKRGRRGPVTSIGGRGPWGLGRSPSGRGPLGSGRSESI